MLDDEQIRQVQLALKSKEMKKAYGIISSIIGGNMSLAQPHNLLGIYYELAGDDDQARKHYRAAYALDPTCKSACRNLERLVCWHWGIIPRDFDYGEPLELEIEETAQ